MERIYLDNAATSWPKPESVYAAVDHVQRTIGAPAGRGGYQQVTEALRIVDKTRAAIARLINADAADNVVFTFNGTDSLSTAIFGLLNKGDHVVTSVVEHNSVLRPLKQLESDGTIEVSYVGCNETGTIDVQEVVDAIRPDTRLVCLIHVSNVTGSIQPLHGVRAGIEKSKNPDAVFLIDAAQSLGHLEIDVQALGCDVLAAPGHKGLLGPLGTGILFVSDRVSAEVQPLRFGGTGTVSSLESQPMQMPHKFEAGNLNVPGIAGLLAGVEFLSSDAGNSAKQNLLRNSKLLLDGLLAIDGLALQGYRTMKQRVGVFSFTIPGFDCHEAANVLESVAGVQSRAGLHCAPLLHRALNTENIGGTVRLSVGLFNSADQIQTALEVLSSVMSGE